MANPQVENGHVAIANEIYDALCRFRIPGEERQVLDVIIRKTYGWNKKEDAISLSQFVEMTGMNKPHIIMAIKGLLLKKVIIITENGNAPAKVYRFNKNYDEWKPLPKKVILPKTVISVTENSKASLPKTVPTKDTNTKTTITKTIEQQIPIWVPLKTFQDYQASRSKKLKPASYDRFFKKLKRLSESSKSSPEEILNQSIENGWEGIFELKRGGNGDGRGKGISNEGPRVQPPEYKGDDLPSEEERIAGLRKLKELTGGIGKNPF